jgi:hypothetical protein
MVALFAGPTLAQAQSTASGETSASGCLAHRPAYIEDRFEVAYKAGCTGHDEPELDPVSSAPNSARDLTWRFKLPTDRSRPVSDSGVFWFGGTVHDPNSLFKQAFLEVQFYPDSIVKNCNPNGGWTASYARNSYSVCSPVWSIHTTGQKPNYHEPAAFNGMLRNGSSALVMHAGDEVVIHFHVTRARDGWHVDVSDLTRGTNGRIVLNSKKDGPLMPEYNRQQIGNALKWGSVNDTPNSFVWEIGHTSEFSSPAGQFCVPGQTTCDSYDTSTWAGTSPIDLQSVTFGDGSTAHKWAVVSDYGGKAEVKQYCGSYGGPYCIYPWFSTDSSGAFNYGVHFADTVNDYGRANQFAQQTHCGGPFGPNSTYCDHVIIP